MRAQFSSQFCSVDHCLYGNSILKLQAINSWHCRTEFNGSYLSEGVMAHCYLSDYYQVINFRSCMYVCMYVCMCVYVCMYKVVQI